MLIGQLVIASQLKSGWKKPWCHELPASSKWPFDQPNGGHLKPRKTLKKGHSEPTVVLSYSSVATLPPHHSCQLAKARLLQLPKPPFSIGWDGAVGESEWMRRSVSSKTTWKNVVSTYPPCWGTWIPLFCCWGMCFLNHFQIRDKRHQF